MEGYKDFLELIWYLAALPFLQKTFYILKDLLIQKLCYVTK